MGISEQKSEISCPKCKKNLGLTLGDIKPSKIKCPHCGIIIELVGNDDLSNALKEFDNVFKNFGR